MEEADFVVPPSIPQTIDFDDGSTYELVRPLTSYKTNHDGTPLEAATVFSCKEIRNRAGKEDKDAEEKYVIKIKYQVPGNSLENPFKPEAGPSTTTTAELDALRTFAKANTVYAPHLVTWRQAVQGEDGPLPGGYITYMVMTLMAGQSLFRLRFMGLPPEEREEIKSKFLEALREINALGIDPGDRGLRNILWDREHRTCTLIDFELWDESTTFKMDDNSILVKWGLASRPIIRDYVNGMAALFNSTIR